MFHIGSSGYLYLLVVALCFVFSGRQLLMYNSLLSNRLGASFSMTVFHLGCSGRCVQSYKLTVINLMIFSCQLANLVMQSYLK